MYPWSDYTSWSLTAKNVLFLPDHRTCLSSWNVFGLVRRLAAKLINESERVDSDHPWSVYRSCTISSYDNRFTTGMTLKLWPPICIINGESTDESMFINSPRANGTWGMWLTHSAVIMVSTLPKASQDRWFITSAVVTSLVVHLLRSVIHRLRHLNDILP